MKNNFLINALVAVLLGIGSLAALADGAAPSAIEEQRHAMSRLHHWIGLDYNFRTHDLRGQARDATLELDQDGRMHWGFRDEASGALLRFEIHIEDDIWQQTGRISPDDGENWYPMLEMTLHRRAATSANECP